MTENGKARELIATSETTVKVDPQNGWYLKPFVNDYHIKVFEIAFLDDDTRKLFKSDFRHVVDYLH